MHHRVELHRALEISDHSLRALSIAAEAFRERRVEECCVRFQGTIVLGSADFDSAPDFGFCRLCWEWPYKGVPSRRVIRANAALIVTVPASINTA